MNKTKNNSLESYLVQKMNFNRLARVGLFVKIKTPEDSAHIGNELLLNRSILDRALIDMFSPDKTIRNDVFEWLDLNNNDFVFICKDLCLLEPEKVYKTFIEVYKIITESQRLRKRNKAKNNNNDDE